MNKRQLAERLREHRERLGLSQTALARKVRVNQSQVHRWESAAALPSSAKVGLLAQALELDLETLYGWVIEASQDELRHVRSDRDELLAKLEAYADRGEQLVGRLEELIRLIPAAEDVPEH